MKRLEGKRALENKASRGERRQGVLDCGQGYVRN